MLRDPNDRLTVCSHREYLPVSFGSAFPDARLSVSLALSVERLPVSGRLALALVGAVFDSRMARSSWRDRLSASRAILLWFALAPEPEPL